MSEDNNYFSIKQWAEEDRPREKLIIKGKQALSDAELLAILIGSGSRNLSAVELCKQILGEYDNDLNTLGRLSTADLQKYKGIGEAKAITIIAALELGRRRQLTDVKIKPKIVSSKDAYDCIYSTMEDLNYEVFKILILNRNNRVTKIIEISTGGISGTVVDPKVIFKKALDANASSIILTHNHPSGNLIPSQADREVTKKIIAAGEMLDIKVLDHLIISDSGYYSFRDEGLL